MGSFYQELKGESVTMKCMIYSKTFGQIFFKRDCGVIFVFSKVILPFQAFKHGKNCGIPFVYNGGQHEALSDGPVNHGCMILSAISLLGLESEREIIVINESIEHSKKLILKSLIS